MTNWVRTALLVLATAGLLARCAANASTPQVPVHASAGTHVTQRTTMHTTSTYRADGTLAEPAARTVSGSCFTGTVAAAPAPRAYRCIAAGTTLLDPCVAPPNTAHPTVVACRADPWAAPVLLNLTAPLPAAPPAVGIERPWAMQLSTGSRCVATAGTVTRTHGVDVVYACTGGAGADVPRTDASGIWHVDYVSATGIVSRSAVVSGIWRI